MAKIFKATVLKNGSTNYFDFCQKSIYFPFTFTRKKNLLNKDFWVQSVSSAS